VEARGESAGHAIHLSVRVGTGPEPVVVHEKVTAGGREVLEKIDERVASHE
jgi:hypothetical protein